MSILKKKKKYHTGLCVWKSILDSSDRDRRTDFHNIINPEYTGRKEGISPRHNIRKQLFQCSERSETSNHHRHINNVHT
jgi:hypothetical protein